MNNADFDYDEELEAFCRANRIWDDDKKKPTRFVINRLKTVDVKHPIFAQVSETITKTIQNSTYKKNEHDGFTTKHHKHKICVVCFEELRGKQKRFCHHNCTVNLKEIKERLEELEKDGAIGIYWQKNPYGKPQWKDMIVRYENGTEKPLTKKSGNTKKESDIIGFQFH